MAPTFAWNPASPCMVTSDGSELLGYDAVTEGPRWRRDVGAEVLWLASSPAHVYALLADHRLLVLHVGDGAVVSEQAQPGPCRRVLLTPSGSPAIVSERGVTVDAHQLVVADATSVAFHPTEARALVTSRSGEVALFDLTTGQRLKSVAMKAAVTGAAWNPKGPAWLVTTGNEVVLISAGLDGHSNWAWMKEQEFTDVVSAPEGHLVLLTTAKARTLVLGFPRREAVASISYLDKECGQVAFGPAPWFGIGLSGGDANKLNLATGMVHRTDPHEGRVRNRWALSVDIQPDQANAAAQANPAATAPPAAVAPRPAPPTPAPLAQASAPPSRGSWPIVGVLVVVIALFRLVLALSRH